MGWRGGADALERAGVTLRSPGKPGKLLLIYESFINFALVFLFILKKDLHP